MEGMWLLPGMMKVNGSLLFSIDRFGKKSMYFWRRDNGLYFASKIKGLI